MSAAHPGLKPGVCEGPHLWNAPVAISGIVADWIVPGLSHLLVFAVAR